MKTMWPDKWRGGLGLILAMVCVKAPSTSASDAVDLFLRPDAQLEIRTTASVTPIRLTVEVADEKAEQDRGLMNRRLAGDEEGMLFVYPKAAPRIFWMHDTPVSLDMLFFDSDRRLVALIAHAEPFSDRLLKSRVPAQYVLEVSAGFADRHAVRLGAQFRFLEEGTK